MILVNGYEVDLAINPLDEDGNPTQIDGTPIWMSSNPGIVEILPVADGLSAIAKTKGVLGHADINVTADADLSEGIRNIIGTIGIDVPAGEAMSMEIITGAVRKTVE